MDVYYTFKRNHLALPSLMIVFFFNELGNFLKFSFSIAFLVGDGVLAQIAEFLRQQTWDNIEFVRENSVCTVTWYPIAEVLSF